MAVKTFAAYARTYLQNGGVQLRRAGSSVLLSCLLLAGCPVTDETKRVGFDSSGLSLAISCEGAEALLAVLERRTVTEAEIDRLLANRGVHAMVDNTTKYIPSDTRGVFRAALKEFVTTRKSTLGHFRLAESHEESSEIRAVIAELKASSSLLADVTGPLKRYMPALPAFTTTVYGVTGGVSDGFVLDNETQPAFYIALNRAEGDIQGVKLNITHELYHVVQRMARGRVPELDSDAAPAPVRLLTVIFDEGTATYVSEPLLPKDSFFGRSGPYVKTWRASYRKNAPLEKITANFAEVDRLLSGLRNGSMSWKQAADVVFTGYGPGPYFVGYEMTKALDRRHGPARIALLLQQHPAAFFRAYIELYRENPAAAPAKFSKATEAYIDSFPLP